MSEFDLHWLRPLWLWCLLPLVLTLVYWLRRMGESSAWHRVIDEKLHSYVIDGNVTKRKWAPVALFTGWALAILMLAGPVWDKQDVPVFQALQAEVVLFDLSRSMMVDDIAPNRLTRARFKLADLLGSSNGRQIGLIAFTERPYVISPLTEDMRTIEAFLPSLSPAIMPVQGSRLDLAIDRAVTLFEQASVQQGHILYIGDQNPTAADFSAAARARDAGHRVSVLAVGTASGKPLRDDEGQFLTDGNGSIVVPQVMMELMRDLADAGGGKAVSLTTGDSDLQQLEAVSNTAAIEDTDPEAASRSTYWVEYSPWLIWPLMIAMLMMFRRGLVA